MKKLQYLFLLLSLTALIASCTKDIVIPPLPYDSRPAIECMLKPGATMRLDLNRTIAYFDPTVNHADLFIRGANVSISSTLGTVVLSEDSVLNLFTCQWEYFYASTDTVQQGITYDLLIATGGKTYTAQTTTNSRKVSILATDYTPIFNDIYGEHEGVIVDFKDIVGEENYYRYQMNRTIDSTVYIEGANTHSTCTNGLYFHVRELGRAVYKDRNQDGLDQRIVAEPAYKHKNGTVAYISVLTVDKNAGLFYDMLDRQKLATANPFVEPVFLTPLQFTDAIGVFGSYVASDSVYFEYPE